jgi:hypothetical protein
MFNYGPIKHKQMSFVSNGGKFKLYTVLNGLIFPTPTQPRISFERPICRIPSRCCILRLKYKVYLLRKFNFLIIEHYLKNIKENMKLLLS